jgi:hypothetical protein
MAMAMARDVRVGTTAAATIDHAPPAGGASS